MTSDQRSARPDTAAAGAGSGGSRTPALSQARHWGGFLFSGGLAFLIDWAVLEIAVRFLSMPPLLARCVSIAVAMLAAWLSHRTLTFALTTAPSLAELARYVTAASTTALINYGVFAALLFAWPAIGRFAALFIASFVATIFSYLSMRYGVFRRS